MLPTSVQHEPWKTLRPHGERELRMTGLHGRAQPGTRGGLMVRSPDVEFRCKLPTMLRWLLLLAISEAQNGERIGKMVRCSGGPLKASRNHPRAGPAENHVEKLSTFKTLGVKPKRIQDARRSQGFASQGLQFDFGCFQLRPGGPGLLLVSTSAGGSCSTPHATRSKIR